MSVQENTPARAKATSKRKAPAASTESTPSKSATSSEVAKYHDALVYLIATNPGLKFNFRAMTEIHGERTYSSFEHQFRPLRAKAKDMVEKFGQEKWDAILGGKGSAPKTGEKRKLKDDATEGTGASSVPAIPSEKGAVKKKGIAQIKKKSKYQTDDEDDEEGPETPQPAKKRTARKTVKVDAESPALNGGEALVGEDEDVPGFAAEIA